MGKKVLVAMVVSAVAFSLAVSGVFCKDELAGAPQKIDKKEAPVVAAAQPKEESRPEIKLSKQNMTKEETVSSLKLDLAGNDEIFNMVPGLKAEKGSDGKVRYTFKGASLESLSKEEIDSLYAKVRQAVLRLRTDRIEKQMELANQVKMVQQNQAISQAQQVQTIQRTVAAQQSVHAPVLPPAPPSIPSVPKGSSVPPAPPRR